MTRNEGDAGPKQEGEVEAFMSTAEDTVDRRTVGRRIANRRTTDHGEWEEALRRGEEKYRAIFENSTEGIYQSTISGQFLTANPAYALMLGYDSPEELVSSVVDIDRQLYVDQKHRAELLQMINGRGIIRGSEAQLYNKDGNKIWVSENLRAIRDASGTIQYLEGICEDITSRKDLENQLLQSQKMEAVGRLAGGVAHDFNNLLTVINGYSELALRRSAADKPLGKYLSEIRKAGERAISLTRQLLIFSRGQVLKLRLVDLNVIVSDVSKLLRRLIGEDIELVIDLAQDSYLVKADPGQIEQVIMNLVVNARDAMPFGGKLTISTRNAELDKAFVRENIGLQPGSFAVLSVSDTGCGMDEEVKSHLFEPFFTTKEVGRGTGLGLSTVYGIVKQSGGYIRTTSEVSRGSTFEVYLPRVEKSAGEVKGKAKEESKVPSRSRKVAGEPETILLVEDEEMVRSLSCEVLRQNGYEILEAANGGEALLICEQHSNPIHLLLTDVVMPRMNGRYLAERLLSMRPDMKVLLVSGYMDVVLEHQDILGSGISFLQKPFTPSELAKTVRETLDS
jgi:two-component system cell cycle sensor histidine kinase/response regulator CckA